MEPQRIEARKKIGVRSGNRGLAQTVARACGCFAVATVAFSVPSFFSPVAHAQGPSARAYADPPEVNLGDRFRLVVEIIGARSVERVTIPESSWFEGGADPYRPTVGARVADRRVEGSANAIVLSYVFEARQAGLFEVGPFSVLADGRTLDIEPLPVLVHRRADLEVEVKVRTEPARPNVGEEFELIAEVFGSASGSPEFLSPDIFDFAEYAMQSFSSGAHMSWRLRALEPGEFTVSPIRVVDAGITYESEPIEVVIGDRPPPVEVQALVFSESIWVGGEFTLRLSIAGVSELDEEPAIPEAFHFAELVRTEESSSEFRGKSVGRRYVFRATEAGRFEIGPVRIAARGESFATRLITVTIDEVPTGRAEPPEGVSLMAAPNKSRAYLNEPVIVRYWVAYQRQTGLPWVGTISWPSWDDFEVRLLSLAGFDRDEARPMRRVVVRPQRVGQLDLGVAVAGVGDRPTMRNDPDGTYILSSEPLTLPVLALPAEGRPASFRGHVGTLRVASRVDRTRAQVGQVVTLQVEVSVNGDVEALLDPEIDFPNGFAVAEPEVETRVRDRRDRLRGTRTYRYRLTAVTPGEYVIPAVEMSYFDAETESYGTTRTHPFTVTVVPAGGEPCR